MEDQHYFGYCKVGTTFYGGSALFWLLQSGDYFLWRISTILDYIIGKWGTTFRSILYPSLRTLHGWKTEKEYFFRRRDRQ